MNNIDEIIKVFIVTALAFIFTCLLGNISNKLYDIRELMNDTCIHINSYNGECK